MTYGHIVVHVDDSQRCAERLGVAAKLACAFHAELVGMYIVPSRELSPSVAALLPADVVARRLEETGAAQAKAETLFRQVAGAAEVAAIEWRAPAGAPIDQAVANARCTDLVVLGQRDRADDDFAFVEELTQSVVLFAGRPALIVPYAMASTSFAERILVAWDGGREASRALGDALPLLESARQVTVMSIHASSGARVADHVATARLAAYLRSHGIEPQLDHSTVDDTGTGEWLLSRAADLSIDLIVMGAYAHTRLRELVLGGVTRTMLGAMTVPVLMAH